MATKTVDELRNQLNASEEQYKRLLEKNQNDLIWIKQREALVKKSLDEMEAEKNTWKESQGRVILENDFLKKQLKKFQQGDQHSDETIRSLEARIEHLQADIKKLEKSKEDIDKNNRQLKDKLKQLEEDNNVTRNSLKQSINSLSDAMKKNMDLSQENQKIKVQMSMLNIQTQQIIETKDQESSQFEELYQNSLSQISNKTDHIKSLQQKLSQSIQHLKNTIDKNKLLIEQTSQLKKYCFEADDSLQKTKLKLEEQKRKNKQLSANSLNSSQLGVRANQLEQENKILKEMIKSLKTMVRVREVEVQKYRNKLNNEQKHNRIYQQKYNRIYQQKQNRSLVQKTHGEEKKPQSSQRSQRIHRLSMKKVDTDVQTPSQKRQQRKLPKIK